VWRWTIKRVSRSPVLYGQCRLTAADGKALVKFVPPAELVRAREEKRTQAEIKALNKKAAAEAKRAERAAKSEKGRLAPQDMFKPPNVPEGTYGSWNEYGVPLTDAEGKEQSKSLGKKVTKEWATQQKLHDEWLRRKDAED
jgi:cysteinyl-tRNA synthetase